MTTLLYFYFLGQFAIGPFTDHESCQNARRFQLEHGVRDVTQCVSVMIDQAVMNP